MFTAGALLAHVLLFLGAYYTLPPLRCPPPAFPALALAAAALALSGRRRSGRLLLAICAALLGASLSPRDTVTAVTDLPREVNVLRCRAVTGTTRGVMLECGGRSLWASSRPLASMARRGDSVLVLGSADGRFLDVHLFTVRESGAPWDRLRRALCGRWRTSVPERRTRSLLQALAAGERAEVPEGVREVFRSTGTSHLLAVSGLHVGLVAALSTGLAWKLAGRRRWGLLLALAAVASYVLLTGARASSVRAGIMAGMVMCWLALGGGRPCLPGIWAAAVVLVAILSPGALEDRGAQMSFAAVLALLLMGRMPGRGAGSRLLSLLYSGVVVTVALAPLVSAVYGGVSPVAPPATVLSFPFMITLMLLGLPALAPGPLSVAAGRLAEWTSWLWLGALSLLEVEPLRVGGGMLPAWAAAVLLLALRARRRGYPRRLGVTWV